MRLRKALPTLQAVTPRSSSRLLQALAIIPPQMLHCWVETTETLPFCLQVIMQLQVRHRQVVFQDPRHPRFPTLIHSTHPEQVTHARRIIPLLHQDLLDFHLPVQVAALYRSLVVMLEDMKDQVVTDVIPQKLECMLREAPIN